MLLLHGLPVVIQFQNRRHNFSANNQPPAFIKNVIFLHITKKKLCLRDSDVLFLISLFHIHLLTDFKTNYYATLHIKALFFDQMKYNHKGQR